MNRTRALTTILCLTAASLFGAGSREAEAVELTVASLKGPTGIGIVRMMEDRPTIAANVSVKYTLSGALDVVVSRVVSGEVDFAALPTNLAAKLYTSGVPYPMAAMNTWGVLYVLERGDTVRSWDDLRGRDVAVTGKGATPDIATRYLLKENGIDPDGVVKMQYFPHMELAQLLIGKRQNLAILPEPFVTKVMVAAPDIRVALDVQQEWTRINGTQAPLAMGCLVVKAETARKYPRVVEAFLREYAASIAWVNRNPEQAGVLVEKHGIGFTAAEAAQAIPRCNIRYEGASESRPAVQAFLQVLLDYSPVSIGGRLPDDGFYLAE